MPFKKKALGNDKPKAYGATLGKKGAGQFYTLEDKTVAPREMAITQGGVNQPALYLASIAVSHL